MANTVPSTANLGGRDIRTVAFIRYDGNFGDWTAAPGAGHEGQVIWVVETGGQGFSFPAAMGGSTFLVQANDANGDAETNIVHFNVAPFGAAQLVYGGGRWHVVGAGQ
ncbi:MAG: hypothetical protein HYZ44_05500 [Bacteroidetes bacterium]|nr:hypothetical protein [Bacteroidota bacterium]